MIRQPDTLNNYKELGHLIMRIHIFSLFREMFNSPFSFGLLKRAVSNRLLEINIHNIRDYSRDSHHTTPPMRMSGTHFPMSVAIHPPCYRIDRVPLRQLIWKRVCAVATAKLAVVRSKRRSSGANSTRCPKVYIMFRFAHSTKTV